MHGLHLTADLHECAPAGAAMTVPEALRTVCVDAVEAAGLQPVGELFHRFARAAGAPADAPCGITGVVLLAESHVAVHTWPELAAVTLDVYVCNVGTDNSARAHAVLDALIAAFAPGRVERHALERGSAMPRDQRRAWATQGSLAGPATRARIPLGDRPTSPAGEGSS